MLFDQKLDLANLAFTQSPSAEDIGLSFDKVLSSPWRQSFVLSAWPKPSRVTVGMLERAAAATLVASEPQGTDTPSYPGLVPRGMSQP